MFKKFVLLKMISNLSQVSTDCYLRKHSQLLSLYTQARIDCLKMIL